MELSYNDILSIVGAAVQNAVAPLQNRITELQAAADKAEAQAQAQAQAAQQEETAEMAEASKYIVGMKQRLIAAGLLPTDNTNV